ncbi:MAG: hypothetical protein BGO06_05850 [Shinella sp. 65-6]|nr:MAG: hypothetical protein BGO06_05850 [Shinella sp. 65-6]
MRSFRRLPLISEGAARFIRLRPILATETSTGPFGARDDEMGMAFRPFKGGKAGANPSSQKLFEMNAK